MFVYVCSPRPAFSLLMTVLRTLQGFGDLFCIRSYLLAVRNKRLPLMISALMVVCSVRKHMEAEKKEKQNIL